MPVGHATNLWQGGDFEQSKFGHPGSVELGPSGRSTERGAQPELRGRPCRRAAIRSCRVPVSRARLLLRAVLRVRAARPAAAATVGLQKDGTYILDSGEQAMDCQRLSNSIWGRLQVLKSLPDKAKAEREAAAPTAVQAFGRMVRQLQQGAGLARRSTIASAPTSARCTARSSTRAARRSTSSASWPQPMPRSPNTGDEPELRSRGRVGLFVEEEGAAGDDALARFQSLAHLDPSAFLHSKAHPAALEQHRCALDPDGSHVAVPDHRLGRNAGRQLAMAGSDPEGGEHPGFQDAVGIGNLGTYRHPARDRVGRRAYGDHPRLERAPRDGGDAHLDLLADAHERYIALRHAGLHPHGRQIGDRIELVAGVAAHILARADLAGDDGAADRRGDGDERVDRALALDAFHLGVAAPEDAQAVACGRQDALGGPDIGLRRGPIGLRLLELALRRGLDRVEPAWRSAMLRASAICDRPFARPCTAAIRSVWASTTSGLSISNSGSPRFTSSPTPAIRRVTRPEKGASTAVLASSLKAIWPIVDFSDGNEHSSTLTMPSRCIRSAAMRTVCGVRNGVCAGLSGAANRTRQG